MCERDIKAKPSVTKSLPHQAPFAPQEELPQRAAALLRLEKRPALQPCARRHHLTPGDIGTATAAAPLHLNAWQNPALQPCVRRCHVMPGDIGAAAAAAPLRLNAWQNTRCCSHVCAATTSRLGTLALQPPLHRCVSTPGETPTMQPCVRCCHVTPRDIGPLHLDAPAAAAVRAPPPRHTRGRWHCSRPLRRCVLMPGKMPGAAAMCALPPHHAQGHWPCSPRCATASRRPAKRFYAGQNARQNARHCGNFSKSKKNPKA
jgi:hypothetical protein